MNPARSQHHQFKSNSGGGAGGGDNDGVSVLNKLQQIIHSHTHTHTNEGWQKCWEEGPTPWGIGQPTPIIQHLITTRAVPNGRALVPGCGTGYDVVATASPNRYVIGLEIPEIAVKKAFQMSSSSPNSNYFTFLKEDFFTCHPTQSFGFDLIFDYTFFCAVEPENRSAWAQQISNLLKPDGELITLMYPISDHSGGPPYKVSVWDYEEVLCPFGFEAVSISDNDLAIERRKGKEKLGRWKMLPTQSTL